MHQFNINYFDNITTQAQAYLLGYFYGRSSGRLQFNKDLTSILYIIRKELCCDAPIHIYNNVVALNLTNKDFQARLYSAGCRRTPQISSSLPSIKSFQHFLRAIFENYGRCYLVKNKYINISITYNENFINELRVFLFEECNITTRHFYRYEHTNSLTLLINKRCDSVRFLNYIYFNMDQFYCQVKKFLKYQQFIKNDV